MQVKWPSRTDTPVRRRKYLKDFGKWFFVREKNRDIKSDISIIGSDSVYPRISISPGNAVKL